MKNEKSGIVTRLFIMTIAVIFVLMFAGMLSSVGYFIFGLVQSTFRIKEWCSALRIVMAVWSFVSLLIGYTLVHSVYKNGRTKYED